MAEWVLRRALRGRKTNERLLCRIYLESRVKGPQVWTCSALSSVAPGSLHGRPAHLVAKHGHVTGKTEDNPGTTEQRRTRASEVVRVSSAKGHAMAATYDYNEPHKP